MYLNEQHCLADTAPQLLEEDEIKKNLKEIPQWVFSFKNLLVLIIAMLVI